VLRRATPEDADAVANVFIAARAEQEFIPRLHSDEEHRRRVREWMLPAYEVWVADGEAGIVGFAAVKEDLLGFIYVHPRAQRGGIGKTLLDHVKALRPDGFELWTHQPNEVARRFYEREGLVAVELTDGATNEEKVPDVRYAWIPEGDEQ